MVMQDAIHETRKGQEAIGERREGREPRFCAALITIADVRLFLDSGSGARMTG